MGLSTKEAASTGGAGGLKVTDGVYANLKTIEKVKDLSGKNIDHIGQSFDLALEIQYKDERFPELYIGNLKTDASGEVIGWGGAFIVARIFENVGHTAELNDNNRFNKADLKALLGEELYVVSYTAGTYDKKDGTKGNNYKTWNMTFPADEHDDEEKLALDILDAWQKSRQKGYPKDYTLPLASDGAKKGKLSTSNKSSAKKSSVTGDVELDSEFDDMDDDLPF